MKLKSLAMKLRDLLSKNRSYRRFHEDRPLDRETLVSLVELTRLCPSAANRQPLKYLVSCSPEENAKIFPHLRWAAALEDWPGPSQGERPTGYIVILGDTGVHPTFSVDPGIVAQSMLLAAVERGLGGCMIGSIDRKGLRRALSIPEPLEIVLVVALGTPKETVVLEETKQDGQVDYWRDADGVHHVPKRPLQELLFPTEDAR
ncbi:MAG: nitroreductase family protein [Thermoguttaceae bacterium]